MLSPTDRPYKHEKGMPKSPWRRPPDVSRLLQLTSLAPDLTESILRGDGPDGLSLAKLRKNLPVRWDEERQRRQ